jgi:hypothetical protein
MWPLREALHREFVCVVPARHTKITNEYSGYSCGNRCSDPNNDVVLSRIRVDEDVLNPPDSGKEQDEGCADSSDSSKPTNGSWLGSAGNVDRNESTIDGTGQRGTDRQNPIRQSTECLPRASKKMRDEAEQGHRSEKRGASNHHRAANRARTLRRLVIEGYLWIAAGLHIASREIGQNADQSDRAGSPTAPSAELADHRGRATMDRL